jgi:decaprenylphospho-beta-D-ribofuranose 2-oxidase
MQRRFASLDQQAVCLGLYAEPRRFEDLKALATDRPLIPRGAGVCYVGASFGTGVRAASGLAFNRVLHFDPEAPRITVGAGMSMGELGVFLRPYGLYLPPLPGHPQITIGGCVACNVHGKNPPQHGVFADWVEQLELYHPASGVRIVSRATDPELFELTCGGLGLTGMIVTVTLRLAGLPASAVQLRKLPVGGLAETCERMTALYSHHDFLYSWNDLSVFDGRLGRGYIVTGDFAPDAQVMQGAPARYRRLDPSDAARWRLRVFHPALVPWINRLHLAWEMRHAEALLDFDAFVFPNPGPRRDYYFDLYGRRGFLAHMLLVPVPVCRSYVAQLERALRRHRQPMLVVSLKVFDGPQRLLHYNGTGVSMHFHVPNTTGGQRLLADMEALSREFGAIRAVYFDSRLSAADARHLYAEYAVFKERLHRHDPQRLFASALSRRLDL